MFCRVGKDPAAQASSRSHSLGAPDAPATEAGHRPASQPQCGGAALVLCPQQTKPWGSKEPARRPRSPNSLAARLGALGSAPPAPLRVSRQSCAGEPVTAPEARFRPSRARGPSGALRSSGARRPPVLVGPRGAAQAAPRLPRPAHLGVGRRPGGAACSAGSARGPRLRPCSAPAPASCACVSCGPSALSSGSRKTLPRPRFAVAPCSPRPPRPVPRQSPPPCGACARRGRL